MTDKTPDEPKPEFSEVGHDDKTWPSTMDAEVWARAWEHHFPGSDFGLMVGWFSNAIMAGYDTATQRARPPAVEAEPVALTEQWLQNACDKIEEALLNHKLSEWHEEDDETSPFPLLDHLSHGNSTATGKHEIEMIVETIYYALKEVVAAPLQQPQEGWNREAAMEKIAAERIAIIQKADRTPAEADRLAALTADLNALSPRVTQSMVNDLRAMTAELRKPQEGWVSVPREPTEAMHQAAVRTLVRCSGNDDFPPRVWRAMIAAAPSQGEGAPNA